MFKTETLVLLVNSLTKSEKKAFSISTSRHSSPPRYQKLFEIIDSNRNLGILEIKELYLESFPSASFDATVKYLYKLVLEKLLTLREEQDAYYSLFNRILKARILFEKSLYDECFHMLQNIIREAERLENYYALLVASRLELEYQLILNFPFAGEKDLLNKHYKINEALKLLRKVNEQSSLYELLKFRIVFKGNVRSSKQKIELNDLVVSEMSIIASSNVENFEIKKLHQLFQANYLISVGDYKSAFRSYSELSSLFESNRHLWTNPPIYYLLTLEGVLDSLRGIRNYEDMAFFIGKLKKLESSSADFNVNVDCLIFLYTLFPMLDRGDYKNSSVLMESNRELYSKFETLSLTRQAELSLYSALVLFGNKDFKGAHKFLKMIILKGKNYYYLPFYRTIRLVNLMIKYETKDFDLIKHETRSIKREISESEKAFRIEKSMLTFLNKENLPVTEKKREKLWEITNEDFESFRHDVFEQQVLKIFDFTAWMESKIRRIRLSEVIGSR